MNPKRHAALATTILLAISCHSAGAADLRADLLACAQLKSDSLRLACVDALIDTLSPDGAPAAVPPPPPSPSPTDEQIERAMAERERQRAEALQRQLANPSREMMIAAFGAEALPGPQQPPMPEQQIKRFEARIAEARPLPRGWIEVELLNGQVWRQQGAGRDLRLDFSDGPPLVVLERAWTSGYWLRNPANNQSIRVTRIR